MGPNGGTFTYAEITSQGKSVTAVTNIPATPTGDGWTFTPGSGTFQNAPWSFIVTLSFAAGQIDHLTVRFFKYVSGVYTAIGNINYSNTINNAKTTYTFTPTVMPAITFGATDILYTDLWYQNLNGARTDNPTVYESTTSTKGVPNEVQIITAPFSM